MKNVTLLIIITFLFTSCGLNFKKTSDLDSLLDHGFPKESITTTEKAKASTDNSTSTPDIFKSESSTHYGVDLSHWQGDILSTMNKEKDKLSFIICKATGGDYYIDPKFRTNWREIKDKGFIRGAYHFYLCENNPKKQAEHFCTTISDIGPNDIAPVLDIEQGSMSKDVSGEQMVKDILVFLKEVERKLNRKPILYTDYAFAQEYFKNSKHSSELAEYDLWLAEYSGTAKPKVPDTWEAKGYKIWQKSASYHLDSQKVDHDEYTGLLSEIVK